MNVYATIEYGALCRQLGVESIDGVVNKSGDPASPTDRIALDDVRVDDDDMTIECERCSRCEDYAPPQPGYLADFLTALVVGDVGTARMLVSAVFQDEASIMVCERALRASPLRRVA